MRSILDFSSFVNLFFKAIWADFSLLRSTKKSYHFKNCNFLKRNQISNLAKTLVATGCTVNIKHTFQGLFFSAGLLTLWTCNQISKNVSHKLLKFSMPESISRKSAKSVFFFN